MEGGALLEDGFTAFAKDHVLFLHVTTKIPGKKHDGLLKEKKGPGWPYLLWLDSNGDEIARVQGQSVDGFQKSAKTVAEYVDVKARFDGGDATLTNALFLLELGLGKHEYEAAKAKAAELELTAEQQAKADGFVFELEVSWRYGKIPRRTRRMTPEQGQERMAKLLETAELFQGHFEAGRFPADDVTAYKLCDPIMQLAVKQKDAALYERVFNRLKQQAGKNPMFARAWPMWEKQLAKLKADAAGQ